jgi:peptidoglycan hydrolase-like protein with peptidoglycan-binding domain
MIRFLLFAVAMILFAAVSASANDNVRAVQTKLKAEGFYFGEVNGAFSSELAAALTRYQIRKGLPVTGQLDDETSKALGAAPAVTASTTAEAPPASETWRRLRKSDEEFLAKLNAAQRQSPAPAATAAQAASTPAVANTPMASDDAPARTDAETTTTTTTPPVTERTAVAREQSGADRGLTLSTERLRDYVGAFVLAGLDPQVGAELEFFADRVRYYDEGVLGRDAIRRSLESYNQNWPRRRFWIAGDVTAEPEGDGRLRVTFPLRYELANGSQRSSGKILKTLVLEEAGDDLQIVAVNETKAR